MSDRLSLTRALEDSGIESPKAERIATEIYNAIHDNVATKDDLLALEQRLVIKLGMMVAGSTTIIISVARWLI